MNCEIPGGVYSGESKNSSDLDFRAPDDSKETSFKPRTLYWTPPSEGYMKINVDAAWSQSSLSTGVGVICRNLDGSAVAAKTISMDANFGAPLAELKTIYEGIIFAREQGFPRIVVESDNKLPIEFILRKISPWSVVQSLLELIRELTPLFMDICFVYSPRECNKVADKIAKFARISGTCSIWLGMIPYWICHLVDYDHFAFARVAI